MTHVCPLTLDAHGVASMASDVRTRSAPVRPPRWSQWHLPAETCRIRSGAFPGKKDGIRPSSHNSVNAPRPIWVQNLLPHRVKEPRDITAARRNMRGTAW
jgi:hypothetical protein